MGGVGEDTGKASWNRLGWYGVYLEPGDYGDIKITITNNSSNKDLIRGDRLLEEKVWKSFCC